MTDRPLIPYLSELTTDTVRVSRATERHLAELLHQPVKIRNKHDLAHALVAALQVVALETIQTTATQAQRAGHPDQDDHTS
jgi:hypothetical protein